MAGRESDKELNMCQIWGIILNFVSICIEIKWIHHKALSSLLLSFTALLPASSPQISLPSFRGANKPIIALPGPLLIFSTTQSKMSEDSKFLEESIRNLLCLCHAEAYASYDILPQLCIGPVVYPPLSVCPSAPTTCVSLSLLISSGLRAPPAIWSIHTTCYTRTLCYVRENELYAWRRLQPHIIGCHYILKHWFRDIIVSALIMR